jgi:hypothetical protein
MPAGERRSPRHRGWACSVRPRHRRPGGQATRISSISLLNLEYLEAEIYLWAVNGTVFLRTKSTARAAAAM